jgi:hypothetical protein
VLVTTRNGIEFGEIDALDFEGGVRVHFDDDTYTHMPRYMVRLESEIEQLFVEAEGGLQLGDRDLRFVHALAVRKGERDG